MKHSESPKLIADKDEEAKFLFTVDNKDRLRWLIINGLAKVPAERIAPLIASTIRSASDVTMLADVLRGILGDLHPAGGKRELSRINLGDETENVRELLVSRIRELAGAGEIWKQAKPEELLWFWWAANKEDEVKAFNNEAMNSAVGLLGLLNCSVNVVRSTSGNYERVSPTWSKLVDLNALHQRAVALIRTGTDANVKLAERFLAALKRGQESSF